LVLLGHGLRSRNCSVASLVNRSRGTKFPKIVRPKEKIFNIIGVLSDNENLTYVKLLCQ
jgi:hypothetical protein